ncbi:MAG: tRNA (5-methylaminomethyl-2-thiouridine)(34)-methyltransferase MnmD [Chitinophagaceae bacterium]|nr:tRNA (5-methylaminomethyl-2-thiouridine)(34)-methyltransferase MnmD [Chitinophagaceae bacterium]
MERMIILTKDGSHTISIPEMKVTYHSVHGAIQESQQVFIQAGFYGLHAIAGPGQLCILEVGFGTGLNMLLTAIEAEKTERNIYYAALEPNPLDEAEAVSLNYCRLLDREDLQEDFIRVHRCPWNKSISVTEHLLLHKSDKTLQAFQHATLFNLIYFDAFAPVAQPELWTKEIFEKLYKLLLPGGILVTYCSKGVVRRNMQAAGFTTERLPGPPGKREMLRATKRMVN